MKKLYELLSITRSPVSHAEKLISTCGGFVAVFCVYSFNDWVLGASAAVVVVASIGATAVLLFISPHSQLSQPWSLVAGHVVSAFVGVTCAKYLLDFNVILAASLAVSAAIAAMYYLNCIHPPGGATALSAIIGGEPVYELGYQFVLSPIAISVLIVLIVAIVFNYKFQWRRYPAFLYKLQKLDSKTDSSIKLSSQVSHDDVMDALREIDSFIDISEHDLLRIYDIVARNMQRNELSSDSIKVGGFYSNGELGESWSVRQVVDQSTGKTPDEDLVVYKVVAGQGRRSSGYSSRKEFLRWAKHQVVRDEEKWRKFADADQQD